MCSSEKASKTLVVYSSKYGSSKKYAEYIAEQLQADICEFKKDTLPSLESYDTIIYGAGLYAGTVNGSAFFRTHQKTLADKNCIVFTCGLTNPLPESNREYMRAVVLKMLPAELHEHTEIFHFGGCLPKKLGVLHKLMIAGLVAALKRKAEPNEDEKLIMSSHGQELDLTDIHSADELIASVRKRA